MVDNPREKIIATLNEYGIPFEIHDHEPIQTVLEGQKRFNSKEAARFLGTGHLSFASQEDLGQLMETFPGAVSLLGLIFDEDQRVELILDPEVLEAEYIDCHPNSNDCSLKISQEALKRLLTVLQRTYRLFKCN